MMKGYLLWMRVYLTLYIDDNEITTGLDHETL